MSSNPEYLIVHPFGPAGGVGSVAFTNRLIDHRHEREPLAG
jgi:hypothetical protein